jgi:hypothetical protein
MTGKASGPKWQKTTKEWRLLLDHPDTDPAIWNRRRGVEYSFEEWISCWHKLWTGWNHPRRRLTIWRIVKEGFYTNKRGRKWHVSRGMCPVCRQELESTEHLFF